MTRLEEIRKRDAVLNPSWFTVDDTDDCVLRVDQTLAARAIKDRRWLLERVDHQGRAIEAALHTLRPLRDLVQMATSFTVRTSDSGGIENLVATLESSLRALHAKETPRG